jgi:heptosyltransferase-2
MLRGTLGIRGSELDCSIQASRSHISEVAGWLEPLRKTGARLIALAPGAAYGPAKQWPQAYYAGLVDLLANVYGAQSILVGSPTEFELCETIARAANHAPLIAAGRTNVGQLAALFSLCNGFAGNDSGSMHLAAAVGLPTVGIFGSTDPGRTGPIGRKTATVYHNVECSPCLQRTCRYNHYNCLLGIAPAEIAEALKKVGVFE